MCGQQPSCYPIGYQLNSRINCPRSSPCLPCRMKSIKENEGQYQNLHPSPQRNAWRASSRRLDCRIISCDPTRDGGPSAPSHHCRKRRRARAPTLLPIGGRVHQAEQAAAAVTGREHGQQAAHVPGRAERAVRLRDYFALQLHLEA